MSNKSKTVKAQLYFAGNIRREKGDDGNGRTITGTAIVFGVRSLPQWADDEEVAYEVIDEGAVDDDTIKNSDILLTMYHDRELLLGRCRNGEGTMKVSVDKNGVTFACEAPETSAGNDAVVYVDRGDITGCSFIGEVAYDDMERVVLPDKDEAGRIVSEYHVKKILALHDFTITTSPAYPSTDTEIKREMETLVQGGTDGIRRIERERKSREQVAEMQREVEAAFGFRPFGCEW